MAERQVIFDVVARDRASAEFAKAGRSADDLSDRTSRMGQAAKRALVGAALAAGAMAVEFGRAAIDAAKESQRVAAQTDAVLKSTGGAANVTAEQVANLSHRLQMLSGVSDETIQSGANMLLTFTNVRNEVGRGNDVFNQATKTLLDMSVATGVEAKQAAVQLGKALNDPIAGISSLTRVGVTFSAQQREQIKLMVEQGDVAGAQKLILAELNREFGGSAKAQGDAMTSGERLSMRWGDLQEQVGEWLIPKINALIDAFVSTAEWVDRNRAVVVPLAAAIGTLTAAVVAITTAARIYTAVQTALNIVLDANPIGLVVLGLAALAAAIVLAYQRSETFRNIVQGAFAAVKTAVDAYLTPARIAINAIVGAVQRAISAIQRLLSLANRIPGAGIVDRIGGVAGAVGGAYNSTIGRIPGFDIGGVVPGRLGSPQLIVAHGGETILPTHRQGSTTDTLLAQAVELLAEVVNGQRRQVDQQMLLARTY